MKLWNTYLPLVGRILISAIFLMSALNKLVNWNATLEQVTGQGLPTPQIFLIIATALELFGSISVILGLKARWGAVALLLFLIPVTLIMHDFWNFQGQEQQRQMINFVKNWALIGGLVYVWAFGAGPVSFDGPDTDRKEPTPI